MTPLDDARKKILIDAFWMPSVQTMASRKSSITNAFVNAIIPVLPPTVEEIDEALRILQIDPTNLRCSYCGVGASEWDHLRPLVMKHRPTGYISEIANLVPSCGKCNQSKGNKAWRIWIQSAAKQSPTGRKIADVAARCDRLAAYERWRAPTIVDFEQILGAERWANYWGMWDNINVEMRKCQDVADKLRDRIAEVIRG
jgi:hypothetical protein